MDRSQEYIELKNELDIMPPALDHVVSNACRRARIRTIYQNLGKAVAMVVLVLCIFTISVNSSVKLAYAMGRIPIISELAKKVALSPSLKAAVENEYVQPMNLKQTQNDITMKIEYIIVDKKQVNIFYSIEDYDQYGVRPSILTKDGKAVEATTSWYDSSDVAELQLFTIDFIDQDVLTNLIFQCDIYEKGGDREVWGVDGKAALAEFSFNLEFDSKYTKTGELIEIHQWIDLDGQKLYVDNAEIYPTHFRLNLKDDENNTAWLKDMDFQIVGEDGEVVERISSGVAASGDIQTPFMKSLRLESNYFSKGKTFQVEIFGTEWLDKSLQSVTIDLENESASKLPEGVRLIYCIKTDSGWDIAFDVAKREKGGQQSPFTMEYCDMEGNEYTYNQCGITDDEKADWYKVTLNIDDYNQDKIVLKSNYSRYSVLSEPHIIQIDRTR